ncbi:hypothetical protein SynPROSU1_02142 [Synechococcus sp. PROS-U-1]|nr:hypothetical protein SynPROSU1_02142 [Synechococcus sp. PROS-U-1]
MQLMVLTWAVCALNKNPFGSFTIGAIALVFGWWAISHGSSISTLYP